MVFMFTPFLSQNLAYFSNYNLHDLFYVHLYVSNFSVCLLVEQVRFESVFWGS